MNVLLEARDLSVRFGGFTAVDGVSLSVARAERVGLIGPNGAGKSTVFAALSGFEPAGGGRVLFDGVDVTALRPAARASRGLARTFQVPREFAHLSVRENLMAAAPGQTGESLLGVFFLQPRVRAEEQRLAVEADDLLRFLNLYALADSAAGLLSGGQKKLLELGRAMMTAPRLILLDEPFAGVNPVLILEIAQRIRELSERGVAVLIVEHNLHALAALTTRLYAMDRGRLLCEGSPADVLGDEQVRTAYMGGVA